MFRLYQKTNPWLIVRFKVAVSDILPLNSRLGSLGEACHQDVNVSGPIKGWSLMSTWSQQSREPRSQCRMLCRKLRTLVRKCFKKTTRWSQFQSGSSHPWGVLTKQPHALQLQKHYLLEFFLSGILSCARSFLLIHPATKPFLAVPGSLEALQTSWTAGRTDWLAALATAL